MKSKKHDTQYYVCHLRELGWQIQAIAELIRSQRADSTLPLNADEVHWGLGEIIGRLGRQVARASNRIEEIEFKKNKK